MHSKYLSKLILGLTSVLFFLQIGKTQTIIASAGSYDQTNELSISWTLGEAISATLRSEIHITQGFQQYTAEAKQQEEEHYLKSVSTNNVLTKKDIQEKFDEKTYKLQKQNITTSQDNIVQNTSTQKKHLNSKPFGREEIAIQKMQLYPNPTADFLNIQLEVQHVEEELYEVQIINLQGKILHQERLGFSKNQNMHRINIQAFSNGQYHLFISKDQQILEQKSLTKTNL